jgi:hypothetical protein
MGLEGPLSDDGECGGLVAGDTAVRDMMEVEREHEHGWDHQNATERNSVDSESLTGPGDQRT